MAKSKDYSLSDDLKEAINEIESAGFPFIKVELEAHFNRHEASRKNLITCTTCTGNGRVTCSTCSGSGGVVPPEVSRILPSFFDALCCQECSGIGEYSCRSCRGTGRMNPSGVNISSEADLETFVLDQIPDNLRQKIVYAKFYRDGSVDSELTFTVPIGDIEIVPLMMDAFSSIKNITNHMDTGGAGLHIALLQTGNYPTNIKMPSAKINNFKEQVTRLLPALFFLASADVHSRGLNFRKPRISSSEKYSAIYTKNNTVLEYRLFETCYKNPVMFFDYVQVINRTLNYYRDTSKKVKPLNKTFRFSDGNTVHRFFQTEEALSILYRRIRTLKPKSKTMAQLRKERSFDLSRPTVVKKSLRQEGQLVRLFNKFIENNPETVNLSTLSRNLQRHNTNYPGYIEEDFRKDPTEAAFKAFKAINSKGVNGQSTSVVV